MTALLASLLALVAQLNFSADRPDIRYHSGETAVVAVTAVDTNGVRLVSGRIKVVTDNLGARKLAPDRIIDLAEGNPFTVSASRTTPGLIHWLFTGEDGLELKRKPGHDNNAFSVGYDMEKVEPGTPEPEDFDRFWSEAMAKYDREIPAEPEIEFDEESSDSRWNVWRVSFAAPGDRKVYGFVTKEKGVSGRLPGKVTICGAGYGDWSQTPAKFPGGVCMRLTVYPFVPDVKLGRRCDYDALNAAAKEKWGVGVYALGGISESREACFFYPLILANNRAIAWFASRDDVDASRLTYAGASQGGGLGLAAIALSGRFARGVIRVPAITDVLSSRIEGRQSGWPRFVEGQLPENRETTARNAPYFCGVNFARRIRTPIRFLAGFADDVCAAHAVYAAYNVCPSADKGIIDGIDMGHGCTPEIVGRLERWLDL